MNIPKMKLKVLFTVGMKTHAKCFEINVTKSIRHSYAENYEMLMKKTKKGHINGKYPCSKSRRILLEYSYYSKVIYRFSEIAIKISMQFFTIFQQS